MPQIWLTQCYCNNKLRPPIDIVAVIQTIIAIIPLIPFSRTHTTAIPCYRHQVSQDRGSAVLKQVRYSPSILPLSIICSSRYKLILMRNRKKGLETHLSTPWCLNSTYSTSQQMSEIMRPMIRE